MFAKIIIIELFSTCLLPGSGNGILFFLTPQWDKLADLNVSLFLFFYMKQNVEPKKVI